MQVFSGRTGGCLCRLELANISNFADPQTAGVSSACTCIGVVIQGSFMTFYGVGQVNCYLVSKFTRSNKYY